MKKMKNTPLSASIQTAPSASQTPLHRGKFKGFTLAEILITLSIIGVVAALTIPTLIQRTGNEEYVSRLMKTYSALSQASESIMTENGSVKTWALDVDSVYNKFKEHLRNAKECGSNTGCMTHMNQDGCKYLNGEKCGNFDERKDSRRLILSDGTQILFWQVSNDCSGTGYGTTNVCAKMFADINGKKGPNIFGRDIFSFQLKENGLYPEGCSTNDDTCTGKGIYGLGWGCACRVIQEGAMNY